MCQVLGVGRSSYYKWLTKPNIEDEMCNHELANLIIDYDDLFGHILGYRRMTEWINTLNNFGYNHKRVYRIMNLLGIKSKIRVKRKKYIQSTPEITAENLLARNFFASAPNQKWVTDVTEFKIKGSRKKIYLSAILDLYDMSIVAYEISTRNDNDLVFRTYRKAIEKHPNVTPLLHSDRGFQYTSKVFKQMLRDQEITQSMSRVGCCIDNGPIEGFWGIIKSEMYYLKEFHSEFKLKKSIEKYINFYNHTRLQKRLNYQPPMKARNEALKSETPTEYPIEPNNKIIEYWNDIKEKQIRQLKSLEQIAIN